MESLQATATQTDQCVDEALRASKGQLLLPRLLLDYPKDVMEQALRALTEQLAQNPADLDLLVACQSIEMTLEDRTMSINRLPAPPDPCKRGWSIIDSERRFHGWGASLLRVIEVAKDVYGLNPELVHRVQVAAPIYGYISLGEGYCDIEWEPLADYSRVWVNACL